MAVEFDGLMIEGPSHSRSYLERLREGLEESFMVSLFRMLIRPGATVLDIGAFLGTYSLLAGQQVGSTGRVYAFEPDARNYPYLVRNLERNSLRDRVVTVPFAVGDKDETRTLFLDPEYWNESSIAFRRRGRMMPISVRCVTLDEFLDKSLVVDVVKVDVEGGELRALSGMEQTLHRGNENLALFVECFPKGLRAAGASAQALARRLQSLGFSIFIIDERQRCLFPVNALRDPLWQLKYLIYLGPLSGRPLVLANLLCVRHVNHPVLSSYFRSG